MQKLIPVIHFLGSWLIVLIFATGIEGCAGKLPRNPLPSDFSNEAHIPGIPEARFWDDEWPKYSLEILNKSSDEEIRRDYSALYNKPHNYLAISGGGANGAFGAGLLAGWTESGTRPEFTMVTGVSRETVKSRLRYAVNKLKQVLIE